MRWDIFCSVIDNLGDIGVSWRLARQLADEHQAAVRLWVDDLAAFRMLAPSLDPANPMQTLGDIEVRRWSSPFPATEPAEIVVETFGCDIPQAYLEAMANRKRAPVWVNLEYLSAENWVEGCHKLPSPHPRLPLTRHFFFPGFTHATGGVLIEKGLSARRRTFHEDPAAIAGFLAGFGISPRQEDELLVSMFCYPRAPIAAVLDAWEAGRTRVRVIAFEGTPAAEALNDRGIVRGQRRGALAAEILPFLSQDEYDRVLWACDWNFVRGEDSFVRAQLAARLFVWQAYPQAEDAHKVKLEAFLSRYVAGSGDAGGRLAAIWRAWNGFAPVRDFAGSWNHCVQQQHAVATGAAHWARKLEKLGNLAGNLARFCSERV